MEKEKKVDALLASDASNAYVWIVDDGDEEVEPNSGITWQLIGDASRADVMIQPQRSTRNVENREHDEDNFVSNDDTDEENNVKFESDEERVLE